MGSLPQKKDITIEFDCLFRVNMGQCDFSSIMKVFLTLLPQLLENFSRKYWLLLVSMKWHRIKNPSPVNVVAMTRNLSERRGMVR